MTNYKFTFKVSGKWPKINRTAGKLTLDGRECEFEMPKDSNILILNGVRGNDADVGYIEARRIGQMFLDVLSASHGISLKLLGGFEYESVGGKEKGIKVLVDAILVETPKTIPDKLALSSNWRSASYFRYAEQAEDTFDRYRNYYLALERVGKWYRNVHGINGSDGSVISDTAGAILSDTNRVKEVLADVQKKLGILSSGSLTNDLVDIVYKRNRLALMHSGDPADRQPFDDHNEREVRIALGLVREVSRQYVQYEIRSR